MNATNWIGHAFNAHHGVHVNGPKCAIALDLHVNLHRDKKP